MPSMRGNVGPLFRAARAQIAAAKERNDPAEVVDVVDDLFKLRGRTRLRYMVDDCVAPAFAFVSESITKGFRSNDPDAFLANMLDSVILNQHWIARVPSVQKASTEAVLNIFACTELDFYRQPQKSVDTLGKLMALVAVDPALSEKLGRLIDDKLDMAGSHRMERAVENYAVPQHLVQGDKTKGYFYADTLLFNYSILWNAARQHRVGAEVMERKFGDLVTALRGLYPKETGLVLTRMGGELDNPFGDFGHLSPAYRGDFKAIVQLHTAKA